MSSTTTSPSEQTSPRGREGSSTHDPILDSVSALGGHWGWLLAYGVVSALLGVVVLAWPGETLLVLAVLFAAQVFVSGVFQLVAAFAERGLSGGHRALGAVLGALSVLVGLMLLRRPLQTLLVVALLLGIWWIVSGITDLVGGIAEGPQPGRGWRVFMGVVSIVAGFYVLLRPGISLATLSWVAGIWLIVYGLLGCVAAFTARRAVGSHLA